MGKRNDPGIVCPRCKTRDTSVRRLERHGFANVRPRRCKVCNHRFRTREIVVDDGLSAISSTFPPKS